MGIMFLSEFTGVQLAIAIAEMRIDPRYDRYRDYERRYYLVDRTGNVITETLWWVDAMRPNYPVERVMVDDKAEIVCIYAKEG